MAERNKPPRSSNDDIDWFTISYRSIYAAVALVILLAGGFGYYTWIKRNPPTGGPDAAPSVTSLASTARFTALDGTVKYKPVGIFEWKSAALSTELRKNDLVRTGAASTAEITFFDGTVVNVRPD